MDVDFDDRMSHGIYTVRLFHEDGSFAASAQVLIGHQ